VPSLTMLVLLHFGQQIFCLSLPITSLIILLLFSCISNNFCNFLIIVRNSFGNKLSISNIIKKPKKISLIGQPKISFVENEFRLTGQSKIFLSKFTLDTIIISLSLKFYNIANIIKSSINNIFIITIKIICSY